MNRKTSVIFYVLSFYVIAQFIWWTYHIFDLSTQINGGEIDQRYIRMLIGEGAVFLSILFFGIWQIRKSIQKELKLSERQNNFLLSVTHELKTPIASNKLYLQTILKRKELSENQKRELIEKAIKENERLEKMINNILRASQLDHGKIELNTKRLNVVPVFKELINRWRETNEDRNIHFLCNKDELLFDVDLGALEMILNNLIENALKYSDENIRVFLDDKGEKIIFGVSDSGEGIPLKFRKDIFKKFYRLEDENVRSKKGSGLGLFIVGELVKLHGWDISCKENEGSGITFEISLRNE